MTINHTISQILYLFLFIYSSPNHMTKIRNLDHPNIVQLYEVLWHEKKIWLVRVTCFSKFFVISPYFILYLFLMLKRNKLCSMSQYYIRSWSFVKVEI